MASYYCTSCGAWDETGWTYYYIYVAMNLPPLCARCDPRQRCHFHHTLENILAANDE
jgi:hypothetical protein